MDGTTPAAQPVSDIAALQIRFELPVHLAEILLALLKNKVVTVDMLEGGGVTKHAKVGVHRLRARLEENGLEIKSRREVGYWLEDDARKSILAQMRAEQEFVSLGDGDTPRPE